MALFRRRKRFTLGTFVAPVPPEPAPVARVVEEGMIIARSAVRMSVKNRIIVGAVRDGLDFDVVAISAFATDELLKLADQNVVLARRQYTERNISIYRSLANALTNAATDTDALEALVEQSRRGAWHELSSAVTTSLAMREHGPQSDPRYEIERPERLRQFIAIDMARLELEMLPEY